MRPLSPRDPGWEPRCETAREFVAQRVPPGVPEPPPSAGLRPSVDVDVFKSWSAEAQERALDLIRQRELNPWRPFYCPVAGCDGQSHGEWDWRHARWGQRPPPMSDDWLVWLLLAGRGSGKSRAGAELVHRIAKKVGRIHLIAPTGPDLRENMVEGESGLQATAPPDFIPQWEPSKKKLTWPNGAVALGFSAEEPDRLRGPQCHWTWIDEPALMPLIDGDNGVWNNMLFGLRLVSTLGCRVIATTTPRSTKWMKGLVKEPTTRVSRFSTYDNLQNLDPSYARMILNKYEGTRIGRQELHAELLEDVEGALWQIGMLSYCTQAELPEYFDRIVVAIDPAGTANARSDETGIVVLGLHNALIYVLQDATGKYSPSGWATEAVRLYNLWSADAIVAEKNYGGDMVTEVLDKNGASNIRILMVTSRRGKVLRAEPIVALYEKSRVIHLRGKTQDIEDEQLSWVPGPGSPSPNRIDALVHGATELAHLVASVEMASPADLEQRMPVLSGRR